MAPPSSSLYVRLGEEIGSSAFSRVFKAVDTSTGLVFAVKKSRVSLKVQRTILLYEAQILRLVAGHHSIPDVVAYGRADHFEYMAMKLLECSFGEIVEKQGRMGVEAVQHVADEMLSALEHIHSHRIVHRDIKPDNIMTRDNHVYLIDFGLARPFLPGNPRIHNLVEERLHVAGTLAFASLNAHRGIDLGPRDDLESLAYTLLFLLRGDLPWRRYSDHGTALGRMAHTQKKKCSWSGSKLAHGHPSVFGQLLEYARGLEFNQPLSYEHFRAKLKDLREEPILECGRGQEQSIGRLDKAPVCPVEIGQLIHVQVASRTSIEGYSMQHCYPSYCLDTALVSDEWRTSVRPAIVINAELHHSKSYYMIQVVSLGQGTPSGGTRTVPIFTTSASPIAQGETVIPEPAWPMPKTYCYAFPRPTWFYCFPDEAQIPIHWKISSDGAALLREQFSAPVPSFRYPNNDPDPDRRHDARIRLQAMKFFVNVTPLEPSSLNSTSTGDPVSWKGDRGWFDECVQMTRRRIWENGGDWTGDSVRPGTEEQSLQDSYRGSDFTQWPNCQQERDPSLTLEDEQQIMDDLVNTLQVM